MKVFYWLGGLLLAVMLVICGLALGVLLVWLFYVIWLVQ